MVEDVVLAAPLTFTSVEAFRRSVVDAFSRVLSLPMLEDVVLAAPLTFTSVDAFTRSGLDTFGVP
jgi:hypothetical protein